MLQKKKELQDIKLGIMREMSILWDVNLQLQFITQQFISQSFEMWTLYWNFITTNSEKKVRTVRFKRKKPILWNVKKNLPTST